MTFGRPKPWSKPADIVPKAVGRMQFDKGPVRSGAFKARVKLQPCLVCLPGTQTTPTDPHHLKFLGGQTQGKQKSDYFIVPLCRRHHTDAPDALHSAVPKFTKPEIAWWKWANRDPLKFVASFSKEGREALAALPRKEAA